MHQMKYKHAFHLTPSPTNSSWIARDIRGVRLRPCEIDRLNESRVALLYQECVIPYKSLYAYYLNLANRSISSRSHLGTIFRKFVGYPPERVSRSDGTECHIKSKTQLYSLAVLHLSWRPLAFGGGSIYALGNKTSDARSRKRQWAGYLSLTVALVRRSNSPMHPLMMHVIC